MIFDFSAHSRLLNKDSYPPLLTNLPVHLTESAHGPEDANNFNGQFRFLLKFWFLGAKGKKEACQWWNTGPSQQLTLKLPSCYVRERLQFLFSGSFIPKLY